MKMRGIFVSDTTATPYARTIVIGLKNIETRGRNMLGGLVGERVAVVRTFHGALPMVVGYVTIERAEWKSREWLDAHRWNTMIPAGSKFDCNGSGKYCYFLKDAVECRPHFLPDDTVRHGRSWCEFELTGEPEWEYSLL